MVLFLDQIRKFVPYRFSKIVDSILAMVVKKNSEDIVEKIEDDIRGNALLNVERLGHNDQFTMCYQVIARLYATTREPDMDLLKGWWKFDHLGYNELYVKDLSGYERHALITAKNPCLAKGIGFKYPYMTDDLPSICTILQGTTDLGFTVTNHADYQVGTTKFSFTIFVYVKELASQNGRLVCKTDDANNAYLVAISSSGKLRAYLKKSGTEYKFESTDNLTIGNWYKIVVVFDPTGTPTVKIYINNNTNQAQSASVSHSYNSSSINELYIGYRSDETDTLNGALLDVRCYRTELTTTQINSLFTNLVTIENLAANIPALADFSMPATS